jgi:hypothetical protein
MGRGYDQEKTMGVADEDYRLKQAKDAEYNLCNGVTGQMGPTMRAMTTSEILAELFAYHPPNSAQLPKYAAINQAAKNFAEVILQNCPSSADRSAAIRLIRDARMTANASIALNGLSL